MRAICIKCGCSKPAPARKCRRCGFIPHAEDLVKSVYCSVGRFEDEDERLGYQAVLSSYAALFKRGVSIEYDEQELKRIREQAALLESVTWSVVVMYLLRVFMPAILLLGLLYAIVALLKR